MLIKHQQISVGLFNKHGSSIVLDKHLISNIPFGSNWLMSHLLVDLSHLFKHNLNVLIDIR